MVAGNFPPREFRLFGGRGGRCSGEFPLRAQTHVVLGTLHPKEP